MLVLGSGMSCESPEPTRRPSVRRCVISTRFQPDHFPSELEVEVEGSYAPLTLLDASSGKAGLWGADLWVTPGWQSYTLRLDGRILTDQAQPLTISRSTPSGEQIRSLIDVPNCEQGRWFRVAAQQMYRRAQFKLAYERALSPDEHRRARQGEPDLHGVALDPSELSVEVNGQPYPFMLEGELIIVDVQGVDTGKYHLTIRGQDEAGTVFETFDAPFWIEDRPHRWTRGVMYQVVLDRLSPPLQGERAEIASRASNAEPHDDLDLDLTSEDSPSIGERWGGSLTGVVALLEDGYFERLGVSALWLSPLAPNPVGKWTGVEGGPPRYEGYHGYWATAPRAVGEEWGGAALLERVVELAHARGIRVIVDVALNHVHEQHPYVSAHPEWFNPPGCLCGRPGCDWGTYIETCRFTTYLPDFRWEGTEAMRQQVDDAVWWLERFDLDGLRVDAVPMMPRRITRMLSATVHKRFEGLRTRHLLIGETFTGPREWSRLGWYIGRDGLDGQFDFSWMWALREVIAWESAPMWSLLEVWRAGEAAWGGASALMGLFIGNHDVTRFISEAAGDDLSDPWSHPPPQTRDALAFDRLWLATALTFTLPGIPVLYYGDEAGLSGANDPDNRRPFWPLEIDAPEHLPEIRARHYRRVAQLGRVRRCLDALAWPEPEVTFLATDTERLSFMRGASGEEAIVVIQRQASPTETTLALPALAQRDRVWVDALSGEMIHEAINEVDQRFTLLSLPPSPAYSVRVLIRDHQRPDCLEMSP